MNEFALIDTFFKCIPHDRDDVVFGVGDDAACLEIPQGMQLLVSCDTLVADIHFLPSWDAYDIACKAVMVNLSDMAAMAASPCWLTLALTLPEFNADWLQRFSQGLYDSLRPYHVALVGGDMTRGPLSMTLTIHGLVPSGKAVRRGGAKPGDRIFVSGDLGAAALAVAFLNQQELDGNDRAELMQKLLHPKPRIDLNPYLQAFASAAIDISDGLSADLHHLCLSSNAGACITLDAIPVHPLVKKYQHDAIAFALRGGDDYELCFTVPAQQEKKLLNALALAGISCYPIGVIEAEPGLRGKDASGAIVPLSTQGYSHF